MTRLIIILLVALAAWQASIHYHTLFESRATNEIVVRNEGSNSVNRLRVIAGSQTFVREVLGPGQSATFKANASHKYRLRLVWYGQYHQNETTWKGPEIDSGLRTERHILYIYDDGHVTHSSEAIGVL